jgi:tetratricopeptide (TPR) repeat protein
VLGLIHLGRPWEALARLDDAAQLGGHGDDAYARGPTLSALVNDDACRRQLENWVGDYGLGPDDDYPFPLPYLLALMEASIALGDARAISRLPPILAPVGNLAIGAGAFRTPARLLGEAAAFLGKYAQAREWFNRAIAIAGQISFRPELRSPISTSPS